MGPMVAQLIKENVHSAYVGLYWYCTHYHGGMSSTEYRILSSLDYTPGCGTTDGPDPDDCIETEIYRALEEGEDMEEVHAAINVAMAEYDAAQ